MVIAVANAEDVEYYSPQNQVSIHDAHCGLEHRQTDKILNRALVETAHHRGGAAFINPGRLRAGYYSPDPPAKLLAGPPPCFPEPSPPDDVHF